MILGEIRTRFILLLGCTLALSVTPPASAADPEPTRPPRESVSKPAPDAAPDALAEPKPDAAPDDAAGPAPGGKPRTGSFRIKIPTRCKDSAIPLLVSRFGFAPVDPVKDPNVEQDYDLANESFEVYVPPAYTGKEPYGLIVWVNAGPTGNVNHPWVGVLDKHKLIWVGANNSGNNRNGRIRLGLAVDAAHYMPTAFNIDKDRVYVSGGSGGGRCSSMLGIAYPDYFTGGSYPIIGCNFYRRVEVAPAGAGKGAEFYEASFKRPARKLWELAAKERRHVYLTGDNDANRLQTELNYKAAKKDGFKHVTYLQVPGMGHQTPDAEWFEKGIVALDEGRHAVADAEPKPAGVAAAKPEAKSTKPEAKPAARTAARPAAPTPPAAQAVPAPAAAKAPAPAATPGPDDDAEKLLKLARLYLDNRLYSKAREKLKQLLKDHPNAPQAAEAQKLLREIGTR